MSDIFSLLDFFRPSTAPVSAPSPTSIVAPGTWPTKEEIDQARAAGFGHEYSPQSVLADDDTLAALMVANRSPAARLGFDRMKSTRVQGLAETEGLAGMYDPKEDHMYYDAATPSALVHESTHRGVSQLYDQGPPQGGPDGYANRIVTHNGAQELFVRNAMDQVARGREGVESEAIVKNGALANTDDGDAQRKSAALNYDPKQWGGKVRIDAADFVQRRAAEEYARRRPFGGPR